MPVSENGGHGARVAVAMKSGNDPQRTFIRRTGDQAVPNSLETRGVAGEIRAAVALMRKRNQSSYRVLKFIHDAKRRIRTVLADVDRSLVNIGEGFGVKRKPTHAGVVRRAAIRSRRRANASSPGMSFTLPLWMPS